MIAMEKILEKISAYQFLNYIIPGTIFIILLDVFCIYNLLQYNIFLILFGRYFLGVILSRIGSLVIEFYLKKWKFIVFASYEDFKDAESQNPKVSILSTENNLYRTILAMLLILLILFGLNLIPIVNIFLHTKWMALTTIVLTIFLFLFAYRKQTSYVRKTVEHIIKSSIN